MTSYNKGWCHGYEDGQADARYSNWFTGFFWGVVAATVVCIGGLFVVCLFP